MAVPPFLKLGEPTNPSGTAEPPQDEGGQLGPSRQAQPLQGTGYLGAFSALRLLRPLSVAATAAGARFRFRNASAGRARPSFAGLTSHGRTGHLPLALALAGASATLSLEPTEGYATPHFEQVRVVGLELAIELEVLRDRRSNTCRLPKWPMLVSRHILEFKAQRTRMRGGERGPWRRRSHKFRIGRIAKAAPRAACNSQRLTREIFRICLCLCYPSPLSACPCDHPSFGLFGHQHRDRFHPGRPSRGSECPQDGLSGRLQRREGVLGRLTQQLLMQNL